MTAVDPDALRFDYEEFTGPVITREGWLLCGRMRATWDSPTGPFYMAWPVQGDETENYESDPDLRRLVALRVAEAHERAVGSDDVERAPT